MLEELIAQYGPELFALAAAFLGAMALKAIGALKTFIMGTPMKWDDELYNRLADAVITAGKITPEQADNAAMVRQHMKEVS